MNATLLSNDDGARAYCVRTHVHRAMAMVDLCAPLARFTAEETRPPRLNLCLYNRKMPFRHFDGILIKLL